MSCKDHRQALESRPFSPSEIHSRLRVDGEMIHEMDAIIRIADDAQSSEGREGDEAASATRKRRISGWEICINLPNRKILI